MNQALELLIKLLKGFEGCRLVAYQDIVGVWTIGYGETLGVHAGMIWTQQEAEERLRMRAMGFMSAVLKRCPALYLRHYGAVAACTSLAYNIGVGAFGASSVCRHTMRGELEKAGDSFLLWDKAGGKRVRGLTRRREVERTLYLS